MLNMTLVGILFFYLVIIIALAYITGYVVDLTRTVGTFLGAVIGILISVVLWFYFGRAMYYKSREQFQYV